MATWGPRTRQRASSRDHREGSATRQRDLQQSHRRLLHRPARRSLRGLARHLHQHLGQDLGAHRDCGSDQILPMRTPVSIALRGTRITLHLGARPDMVEMGTCQGPHPARRHLWIPIGMKYHAATALPTVRAVRLLGGVAMVVVPTGVTTTTMMTRTKSTKWLWLPASMTVIVVAALEAAVDMVVAEATGKLFGKGA